jgi:hypothetical protein
MTIDNSQQCLENEQDAAGDSKYRLKNKFLAGIHSEIFIK